MDKTDYLVSCIYLGTGTYIGKFVGSWTGTGMCYRTRPYIYRYIPVPCYWYVPYVPTYGTVMVCIFC